MVSWIESDNFMINRLSCSWHVHLWNTLLKVGVITVLQFHSLTCKIPWKFISQRKYQRFFDTLKLQNLQTCKPWTPKNLQFYLEMVVWRPVSKRVSFIGTESIFKPFFRDFVFYLIWLTAQWNYTTVVTLSKVQHMLKIPSIFLHLLQISSNFQDFIILCS